MKVLWAMVFFTFTFNAFAGGGHFHRKKVAKCRSQCTADDIKAAAHLGVKELVKWGKMDAKWEKSVVEQVEKKTFKKSTKTLTAWVVTLSEKANNKSSQKVYVFFTEKGKVFRTNSSGVLK